MTAVVDAPARGASVVVVEDHLLLAESLALSLRHGGFAAHLACLDRFDELAGSIVDRQPDLVLLDLDLGIGRPAVRLLDALVAAGVRVLLVTGTPDRLRIADALERGAVDWVPKTAGVEALVDATTHVLGGGGPIDPTRRHHLLQDLARSRDERRRRTEPFAQLTERERNTLQELRDGHSVGDIARRWVVSEATVRTHVRGVLSKLRVTSQLAAVAAARRADWHPAASPTDD